MQSTLRILLVGLLLTLTMCLGRVPLQIGKEAEPAVKGSMGRHLLLEGVPNFGEVMPRLYRGGQPTHEGFVRLAKMGIDIVVDTGRSTREKNQIQQLGMRYVSLPWYCPLPKDEVFARFLRLIRENPSKRIFVHCELGDDRTGMMIAAYRMGIQGWTAEQARREMREFGYTALHHLMCPGLGRYEKRFPQRLKKSPAFQAGR